MSNQASRQKLLFTFRPFPHILQCHFIILLLALRLVGQKGGFEPLGTKSTRDIFDNSSQTVHKVFSLIGLDWGESWGGLRDGV